MRAPTPTVHAHQALALLSPLILMLPLALIVALPACSPGSAQQSAVSAVDSERAAGEAAGNELQASMAPIKEPIPIPPPTPKLEDEEALAATTTQQAALDGLYAYLDEQALKPHDIQPMYQRIAADLNEGKPLVIATFVALWGWRIENGKMDPSWDTHYGNDRYVGRAHKDRRANILFEHTDWQLVAELEPETYAIRTKVYHQVIEPNRRWKELGVTEPFDVYLVLRAFPVMENGALELANSLRRDDGRTIRLEDGTSFDLGQAQVVGYAGHNFHYDYEDFDWRGLDDVSGRTSQPTGLFTITCRSATVPGFMDLVEHNVHVLGFTRNFVSAEGYSLLSFVDGVLQARTGEGILDLANESYYEYHYDPEWRPYRPFVGHAKRMFRPDDGTVRPRD